MSVNSTMAYRSSNSYRSSAGYSSTTASSYRPYRSTYSSDFTSRSTTSSSSPLYKSTGTYLSHTTAGSSRSPSYMTSSRTLPTLPRSTAVVHSFDRSSSSRTLPLRASATSSYETSRSNYDRPSYGSTSTRSSKASITPSLSNTNYISSSESTTTVRKRAEERDKENGEVSVERRSSNDRPVLKQLGGNPEEIAAVDNDTDGRSYSHEDRAVRRSPSVERVSRDSMVGRSRRFQSVDRSMVGNQSFVPQGAMNSNTDRGQAGLRNLGNTCFMNSVLQCLSNTRPLLEFCLISSQHETEINRDASRMKGDLITSFIKLMQSMWSGHDSVSPTDFKSEVSRFARRFGGYNQQDAQEFLIALLEGLQDDLNRVRSKNKKRHIDCSNDVETIAASDKARESWKRYLDYENSKIVDIFVGQLRSALTCLECGYVSNTFDPFLDLSLPIPKGRNMSSVNLLDCFELFTQEEILEGDERPTCARCKKRQKCTKRFSIQKFPQILILHLKRFSQDYSYRSKLSTEVKCPTKNLDLKKFSAEKSAGNISYDLYAVSNHSGTPSGGHYTAAAKNPYTRQWHYFNDQRVNSAAEAGVISSEAYILFYELSSNG